MKPTSCDFFTLKPPFFSAGMAASRRRECSWKEEPMSTRLLEAPATLISPHEPDVTAAPKRPPRLPYIDGLRGLALLLVLFYHAWVHPVGAPILLPLLGFHVDVAAPAYFGFAGVRLFVVLSGFCLTYPLAHSDLRMQLRRFWRRRAWRILPPYYVALAIFILLRVVMHRPTAGGDILTHLLLIHNLFPRWMGSINGAWWTLALEGQFYLIFPLLVASFRRWGVWRTLLTALTISLAWRTWAWNAHDMTSLSSAYFWCYALPGRLFEFTLGMTAAIALARRKDLLTAQWQRRYLIAVVGFAALDVFIVTRWNRFAPMADILWGLTFFSLVMYAATRNAMGSPVFTWRPLGWIGSISYSVYLLHDPLIQQASRVVRPFGLPPLVTWLAFELVAIPLSIALGWLFYRCVESHFLGSCPEFRWPAAFRRRFLDSFSRFRRRGVSAEHPSLRSQDA
jgi:peptidoglycan/LPS O-acetylase OafA/YrhL